MNNNNLKNGHFEILLSFLAIVLCGVLVGPRQLTADDAETVFVSIAPQKFFVEQIVEDSIRVEVMVEPGASPHIYEPKPSQMRKLTQSDVYLSVGVNFENVWLKKLAGINPDMKIVQTDAGIVKRKIAEHHHDENLDHSEQGHEEHHEVAHHDEETHHDEHEDDTHEESGLDPHIWLSPLLVKKQAHVIAETLIDLYPGKQAIFEQNLANFLGRIDELDQKLRSVFADKKGMKFMVFHPSWGYFANDYGLEQIAIENEGKDPKPAQLQQLIKNAKVEGVKVIFAQPQFSVKSAELLAREIGGSVILIDPLAEDWLNNLQMVAEKIEKELK